MEKKDPPREDEMDDEDAKLRKFFETWEPTKEELRELVRGLAIFPSHDPPYRRRNYDN